MTLEALLASLRPGGRDFERVCKWALENVPEYRKRLRRVWLWDDWPGRWGRDAGIDLVAEDRDGGLWAVQAKHYDPAYAIKKADVDSFLSESSRPGFTYRLVIASTDHLGPTARRTLDAQEKPVGTLLRSQLEALPVPWPASVTRLRLVTPKQKRPLPHQRRAIAECVAGLATRDRGQLVMACGTGKTLVGAFLADRLVARRVLVLVPSLSLLGQTLREWATASEFDYLAVCSDDTVTKDEQDAVVAATSELGVPVTTDAARIARFLRGRGTGTKVIFSTYQSSPQLAAAQTRGVPAFDLVIADEAHRCAWPQAGVFATVLDPAKIKARKRLFMTATPRYFTGRVKKEAKETDWEVASMDEEAKFGSVLHRLTFAQAIEQDLLSDYQLVVVGVSDREAHDMAERGAFVSLDGKGITDARTLAREIGLLRSMAKYDLHRVVTFHSRIDYASRFASSLPETKAWLPRHRRPNGTLWTNHVSGKMTAGERDARLRHLKTIGEGERGVLTNARCLTEGVDVPTLDGVAFIDPRRSQVDVVQAVGRAIRKAEDKTLGTIVIPVFVEEDVDPEQALEGSEFKRVWEVVRALRDHDEDLAEEIDELRRELGRRGSTGRRPRKIVLDVPTLVGAAFARAFDTQLVETSSSSWEFWFGLLEAFVAREGHAFVLLDHREPHPSGHRLGGWINAQRTKYAHGVLDADRAARLSALPGWTWRAHETRWLRGLNSLKAFVEREGTARVPQDYVEVLVDGNRYALGTWVSVQRRYRREGRLDPARAEVLESLQGWTWDPDEAEFDEGFAVLKAYVAREGHARVQGAQREPPGDPTGFQLGKWASQRRSEYRQGILDTGRAARLSELPGWDWDPLSTRDAAALAALQAFREREGHLRIPNGHIEPPDDPNGFPLRNWVGNRRTEYKNGKASAAWISRLEAIPGWSWEPRSDMWLQNLGALKAFQARNGHLRVAKSHVDGDIALGVWVSQQRRLHNRGELAADRTAALEAVPGWTWDALADRWESDFGHLLSFVEREGHARVPQNHVEREFKLGSWVNSQRQSYRRARLSKLRASRLEQLPGWVWDPHEARWETGFMSLEGFVRREGHARVPQDRLDENGFRLGAWVRRQRADRNAGRLAPERIARLEALPGWVWDARKNA